jgi:DNA-binding transcriptional regulator YiaG
MLPVLPGRCKRRRCIALAARAILSRMLPRERVAAALAYRTPDRIPLQCHPSPAGLYEHGPKLLELQRACGHDFGDARLAVMPDPPGPGDFDADGRYHAIRTDSWGTTWEYRIFGIWGHPIAWPLDNLAALEAWHAPDPPPMSGPLFEAAKAAAAVRKPTGGLRRSAADLKRRIAVLEREVRALRSAVQKGGTVRPTAPKEKEDASRITAKGMRSLQRRLRLTGQEFARLLGVTPQVIYSWGKATGPLRVRRKTRAAILAAREIGAREARRRLAPAERAKKPGRRPARPRAKS